MFKVFLNISYQPASSLGSDQLPVVPIEIFSSEVDDQKVEALRKVAIQFKTTGDELLMDVFSSLYDECKFDFNLVYTSGISAPYDAWTKSINSKPVLYFNLSEWTTEDLFQQGPAVVIHEVTHALLEPFLIGFDSPNLSSRLERIVFNEGIAHFLGFPGNRFTLLEKYHEKWVQSEAELGKALEILNSNHPTDAEKEDLLLKSNTGPFWEKYGAISGMFRAAKVYSSLGSKGLTKAIKDLHLPKN